MKKIITILFFTLMTLSLVGCADKNANISLDLSAAKEAIMATTSNTFDCNHVALSLEDNGDLGTSAIYVYEYNLANYGISQENIALNESGTADFVFIINEDEEKFLFMAKPANEVLKEEVKKNLVKKYNNAIYEEYEGYIIALKTENSKSSYEFLLANSYPTVINNVIFVPKEEAEFSLNIASDLIDEALIAIPVEYTQTSQIVVLKPAAGKEEEVKMAMSEYMDGLQEHWNNYLPDQAELVKNRIETNLGDYLVYIISNNNEALLNAIKSCVK